MAGKNRVRSYVVCITCRKKAPMADTAWPSGINIGNALRNLIPIKTMLTGRIPPF